MIREAQERATPQKPSGFGRDTWMVGESGDCARPLSDRYGQKHLLVVAWISRKLTTLMEIERAADALIAAWRRLAHP